MKGQYKIFEELLIFSIGIGVASMIMLVFNNLSGDIEHSSMENQLKDVNNLISSGIVNTYESGINTTTVMKIPKTIGNKPYVIEINNGNLITYIYGNKKINYTRPIYSINIYDAKLMSSSWYIEINRDNNGIHLKRWGA